MDHEPRLQPPGAGIPFLAKFFARYFYFPKIFKGSWEDANRVYQAQMAKVIELVEKTPPAYLTKKVLIPPLQGLEDSSRYWSIQMTLEHLNIVSQEVGEAIVLLSRGETVPKKADTAQVKPQGEATFEKTFADFKKMAATQIADLNSRVKDRASKTTHDHPWFGPFTAHKWNWLLGIHTGIHRQQIKLIRKGLSLD